MSRVRNALEFLQRYHQARDRYESVHRPRIEAARARYDQDINIPDDDDDLLEAQLREYFVDALLAALNWQLDAGGEDGLPSLIPEAQIRSSKSGNTRFLDYLGSNGGGDDPLLIVETKRPNSLLPKRKDAAGKGDVHSVADEPMASVLCDGLKGVGLTGTWNEWLETLRDYVNSVFDQSDHVPRRVVITSGRWLVIFVDPADTFLAAGTCHPDRVIVFVMGDGAWSENDEISTRYNEVFSLLEHQRVLNESPALTAGEIAFHIKRGEVNQAMHGLRLLYIEEPDFLAPAPVIKVMPVLLLRSIYGAWLQVESQTREILPYKKEELAEHMETIREVAVRLLSDINYRLGTALTPTSIETHYADETSFDVLHGVDRKRNVSTLHHEEYLIITGQHSHYFHLEPTVPACPHHNWGFSHQKGCANPPLVSIESRSTEPRSFFYSGEDHHCTHREVARAKSSQVTPGNRERCGSRSGRDFDPFCEIWGFERHLCCRSCVFEEVCTAAVVFTLPCQRVEQI